MRLCDYNSIINFIHNHTSKSNRCVLSDVLSHFRSDFSHRTLMSIFLNNLQKQVKQTYHTKSHPENVKLYYKIYTERVEKAKKRHQISQEKHHAEKKTNYCEPDIRASATKSTDSVSESLNKVTEPVLVNLANEFRLPPFLMARLIVEQYFTNQDLSDSAGHSRHKNGSKRRNGEKRHSMKSDPVNHVKEDEGTAELRKTWIGDGEHDNLGMRADSLLVDGSLCYDSEKKRVDLLEKRIPLASEGIKNRKECDLNFEVNSQVSLHRMENEDSLVPSSLLKTEHRGTKPDRKVLSAPKTTKNQLSLVMKDPFLLQCEILKDQVLQCMSYDVCYGPINDAIRHAVGLEFEQKLVECVKKQNLPFLDETDLRKRGYDKTPDVKLEVPIAVDGQPVCWIESKASFGDLETHGQYLNSQYYSYWNRFGPGLVIYWFGFVDEILEEMRKQGILILDGFPRDEQITYMDP